MGLFTKKDKYKKLLDEALADYRSERYEECYNKVCEAADNGSPRGLFCKALLMFNDNVAPDSEVDEDALLSILKSASDNGYELAHGVYAAALKLCGRNDELCSYLSEKRKSGDGAYLMHRATMAFGIYDGRESDDRLTKKLSAEAVALLKDALESYNSGKNNELSEYVLYNPYSSVSLTTLYARAQFLFMTVLYCENDWNNRSQFRNSFEEMLKYMPVSNERYRACSLYATATIDNHLGMSDFEESNRAMRICNECYNAMSDGDRELYESDYDSLYEKYSEHYDAELDRINNREVVCSDGYADKNDLTARNIANAITTGLSNYAQSSSSGGSSSSVYTIGGKEYTRGEFGYLYDSEGFKSDYKVDDYNRLYDGNERELGYFNNNGNFISG